MEEAVGRPEPVRAAPQRVRPALQPAVEAIQVQPVVPLVPAQGEPGAEAPEEVMEQEVQLERRKDHP